MSWLVTSILLSVVLTIVLNVVLRAMPGAGDRVGRKLDEMASRADRGDVADERRVRVWFPWKAMLVASLVLTVLLNLLLLIS